jgi:hypothetical protein
MPYLSNDQSYVVCEVRVDDGIAALITKCVSSSGFSVELEILSFNSIFAHHAVCFPLSNGINEAFAHQCVCRVREGAEYVCYLASI